MSILFRIVYAAHANGTHHKLALDALRHMERDDAEDWSRVFLKHVALYLEGSKAPDKSFKDFKNHVLHVGDNYWGGAPEKAEAWYGHTVAALKEEKWADAVYAAGVLSHYYTDPIHPFHTGQTEAENSIHRAVEWTINRSYNSLRVLGEANYRDLHVAIPTGEHWLRELVCDGAEYSHRYYAKLIAHYDIHTGAVRPEEGLDKIGRTIIAELLMYAADGFGRLLDRAITEAGVSAPPVSLTAETFLATLKIPAKWVEKNLSNAEDKALVRAMYDELKTTGRVENTLPEDDRVIRDLHAKEVLAPKLAERAAQRAARIPNGDPADIARKASIAAASAKSVAPAALAGDIALDKAVAKSADATAGRTAKPPALPAIEKLQTIEQPQAVVEPQPRAVEKPQMVEEPQTVAPPQRVVVEPPAPLLQEPEPIETPDIAPAPAPAPLSVASAQSSVPAVGDARRRYLSTTDDLEAAPSIGPKMAERFAVLGILTVGDFLGHDPHDMAELLDDRRFDAEILTDWQDQAQLVIEVPGLRGTHAQLLVGAGYRTAMAVSDADPVELSADVLNFATTTDGKRILRDGNPPDIEKIKSWVGAAREALAA